MLFSRSIPTLIRSISLRFTTAQAQAQARTLSTQPKHAPPIQEENLARYSHGGYHPVRLGDTFKNGEYKVVSKLGWGLYSTVWLVHDVKANCHVALKVLAADSYGTGKDTYELDILRHLGATDRAHPGANHVLGLLDEFKHEGPNGEHVCLVFKAMGPDMSKYRKLFPLLRLPVPVLKQVSRQLLQAMVHLHDSCKVIHTDIKPQNILVETTAINEMFQLLPSDVFTPLGESQDGFYMRSKQISSGKEDLATTTEVSVRLADFGTSSFFDNHLTEWIQPQMLRAPEVTLGMKWDYKVDIWNLGLIIWEFAQGEYLFDGSATATASYTPEAHLSQMQAVLGRMPSEMLKEGKMAGKYFDNDGNLFHETKFGPFTLEGLLQNSKIVGDDKMAFLEFIGGMLRLRPQERLDARELLEARWLARA